MSLVKTSKVHSIEWCDYDQVYKITWEINGRKTNSFSSRGKRKGQIITFQQKALEYSEAVERSQIVVDYLLGAIDRREALHQFEQLDYLCPKDPKDHLMTMLEFALEKR